MPSIQKTAKGYRVQVYVKGQRASDSFPTRKEAQLWAAEKTLELQNQAQGKAGQKKTTHDAFKRFAEEVSPTHKGERWEILRLARMRRDFPNIPLASVQSSHVQEWRDSALRRIKSSSVNRELTLMRSVFEQCRREWGWIAVNPCQGVKRPRESPPRERTIAWSEIRAMLRALGYPRMERPRERVAWAFLLALRTGMREGEIARIASPAIFPSHIHTTQKSIGEMTRDVPLSRRARRIVDKLQARRPEGSLLDLTASQIDSNFRLAKRRAGLSGFTFHDSRHTAATWIGRSGKIGVLELCKMFGWSDPKMAMIYFNPTAEDIASKL